MNDVLEQIYIMARMGDIEGAARKYQAISQCELADAKRIMKEIFNANKGNKVKK